MMSSLSTATIPSPMGPVTIVQGPHGVRRITFDDIDTEGMLSVDDLPAAQQLREFFDGRRRTFDLALDPAGTDFQQTVWTALTTIPYGTTTTYGTLARQLGNPGASRAVGLANGKNPIAIVIPCHRVIGANGSLTGYAGGLDRKQWLLDQERPQETLF